VEKPTRPSPGGQESRPICPTFAGTCPLVRLFSLHPGGPDLRPLRRVIEAAQRSLEPLRTAAEDAVGAEPIMEPLAQWVDVHEYGAELAEHLFAALAELDVLDAAIAREGAS
jgi:hypothetical protein